MEVSKALFGVAILFALSACSSARSLDPLNSAESSPLCVSKRIETKFIVTWEDGHISFENDKDYASFKERFVDKHEGKIRRVEYDHIISLSKPMAAEVEPVGSTSDSWGQTMVQASALWNQGYKGQNVLVGVVDTPVDVTHPQLAGRIAVNAGEIPNNAKDDDGNGFVDDYYGWSFVGNPPTSNMNVHGTHVSGIIAADPSKGPVQGMAPQAKIIPGSFIGDESGSLSDAIKAMNYVASRGAKIINASWGGADCNAALADAFNQLSAQGILFVVAAGNEGVDIDAHPTYPASFQTPNQITVAAATSFDLMISWSNRGYTGVHLAAPGVTILSTVPGGSTDYLSGTSMAAPFVSGAAALLWSAKPAATAAQIRLALMRSVDIPTGHEYQVSSRGRMNVSKALTELTRLVP